MRGNKMLKRILAAWYARLPVIRELREIRRLLARRLEQAANFEAIRLLDFDLCQHPRYADPKRLLKYQFQVCSQNGEDGIIQEILRRIGVTNQIFAEVGVGDGCENNTAFLLSQGWTGFWIDGDNTFLNALAKRSDLTNGCLRSVVAHVTKENILSIFQELGVPEEFDLLALDIDQNTYHLWEGLSNVRPRVVVVEYNAGIPPEIDWFARYEANRLWDGTNNFGASLKAFEKLGRRLGYQLVGCEFTGANAFFIRKDLVGDKFLDPFTAENHYEPPRYWLGHHRGHFGAILDRAGTKPS
jgi:hypothetical protein